MKFVPLSVTVTVAPRAAEFGVNELNAGFKTGAFTVNDCAALVPPLVVTATL